MNMSCGNHEDNGYDLDLDLDWLVAIGFGFELSFGYDSDVAFGHGIVVICQRICVWHWS